MRIRLHFKAGLRFSQAVPRPRGPTRQEARVWISILLGCVAVAVFFSKVMAHWPDSVPLIALGGMGRFSILPTAFSEVSLEATAGLRFAQPAKSSPGPPFCSGYIGLLSYDEFTPEQGASGTCGPRIFRVDQALIYDRFSHTCYQTGRATGLSAYVLERATCEAIKASLLCIEAPSMAGDAPLSLRPYQSDETYLQLVAAALRDIRAGRYYQINLLRYFQASQPLTRAWFGARLDRFGGSYAAFFAVPGLTVASFSPERFVCVRPAGQELKIETFPIKGTAARSPDTIQDERLAKNLQSSRKDLAELHMIVDLMRNDLQRIARPGSVEVEDPGKLLTTSTVHHLEAKVSGLLPAGTSLGAMLSALCPAGSITGAPKREVMDAIRTYEGRTRGYFMGHAFYWDERGYFDSSVLIRTLVSTQNPAFEVSRAGAFSQGTYEFAAGSGIVIGSDPRAELAEIGAKTRVVTA